MIAAAAVLLVFAGWRSLAVIALAVVAIRISALLMAAIVYKAVYVPTKQLRRGTEALGRGDLDVVIDLQRSDELGAAAERQRRRAAAAADGHNR